MLFSFGLFDCGLACADLLPSDFLSSGDKLLVTDTAAGLEWLSPTYTKDHAYDDAFVQSVITG